MKDKNNENYKSILLNCENLQNSFEEEIEKLSLKLESKLKLVFFSKINIF